MRSNEERSDEKDTALSDPRGAKRRVIYEALRGATKSEATIIYSAERPTRSEERLIYEGSPIFSNEE